ncbi:hypothetical protein PG995_008495 [Apiospora arundinis]
MTFLHKLLSPLPLILLLLADVANSAYIPRRQDATDVPRPAIAVKLATTSSLRASMSGAELVEALVRKSQPNSGLIAKRDNNSKKSAISVTPLFDSLAPEVIAGLVQRAAELDPTYEPVDFGAWYQVRLENTKAAATNNESRDPEIAELLRSLSQNKEVASCQSLVGAAVPAPSVAYNDDPRFSEQGYLGPAGAGINAQYAWGFPGGDGAGTTIIDVERGWKLTHEDLEAANITLLGSGYNENDRYGANFKHGTAVLGEMLMVDNKLGGVGIVPSARGHVVGTMHNVDGAPRELQAVAILEAASFLQRGDGMTVEMQVPDANYDLWPVEINDAEFDAIRTATAAGILVFEPAANGAMDMDLPVVREGDASGSGGRALLNRKSPDFRDSGAIMVGASTSTLPRTRLVQSNYGSRVDVHAWGQNILTSTVDDSQQDIYANFSGTSGATPIVAGAALSIQGMLAAKGKAKLRPKEMRKLIAKGGSSTADPSKDRIGVQPDLRALIDGGYLK